MIEIILLAGALSVELEPYAVENQEPVINDQGTNIDSNSSSFQWTTRRGNPGIQEEDGSNGSGDGVKRDQFGRPVEGEN